MTKEILEKNLPTILSIIAIGGVIGTGVTAAIGHKKACDVLNHTFIDEDMESKERVALIFKLTAKYYIPSTLVGLFTILLIGLSDRLHVSSEAALTALAGIIATRLSNMDREIIETQGQEVLDKIRDGAIEREIRANKEKARKECEKRNQDGEVFYEPLTEQFFWSTKDYIRNKATIEFNKIIQQNKHATMEDYLRCLSPKLSIPIWAKKMGWYVGDSDFEEKARYTNYKVEIYFKEYADVDGKDHQATAVRPSIYPMPPSDDYIESMLDGRMSTYYPYTPEDFKLAEANPEYFDEMGEIA